MARLFLLNMTTVRQDETTKFAAGFCANDPAPKPRADQRGDVSRMIQMGMGQQHRIYHAWPNWKRLAIAPTQLLEPLKQATIDKDATLPELNQIARSGHSPGRAKKPQGGLSELGHLVFSLPLQIEVSAECHHLVPFAFDLEIAYRSQRCLIDNPDFGLRPRRDIECAGPGDIGQMIRLRGQGCECDGPG